MRKSEPEMPRIQKLMKKNIKVVAIQTAMHIHTAMQFVYSLWQSLLQDSSLTFRSPNNLTGIVRF